LSFNNFCSAIPRDFCQIMHVRVQAPWPGGILRARLSSGGTGGLGLDPEETERGTWAWARRSWVVILMRGAGTAAVPGLLVGAGDSELDIFRRPSGIGLFVGGSGFGVAIAMRAPGGWGLGSDDALSGPGRLCPGWLYGPIEYSEDVRGGRADINA